MEMVIVVFWGGGARCWGLICLLEESMFGRRDTWMNGSFMRFIRIKCYEDFAI